MYVFLVFLRASAIEVELSKMFYNFVLIYHLFMVRTIFQNVYRVYEPLIGPQPEFPKHDFCFVQSYITACSIIKFLMKSYCYSGLHGKHSVLVTCDVYSLLDTFLLGLTVYEAQQTSKGVYKAAIPSYLHERRVTGLRRVLPS